MKSNVPRKTREQRARLRANNARGIVLRSARMEHRPRAFARKREIAPVLSTTTTRGPRMPRLNEGKPTRRRSRVTAFAR